MSRRISLLLLSGFLLLVLAAVFYPRPSPIAREQTSSPPSVQAPAADVAKTAPTASTTPLTSPGPPMTFSTEARLEGLWQRLTQGRIDEAALSEFRQALLSGSPPEVMAAIRAFLSSGRDAATGESFLLGENGELEGAPTLRVLLLDLLGRVARTASSDVAAITSRSLLESRTSADEWAVALRNVGWQEPQAKAYLAGKAREMLAWAPWKAAPSAGYLEAFDVSVFAGDASFVPVLSDLVRTGSPPLQRAATLALDRLSEASPLAVLEYLNAHPAELADKPFLRADYYAKADLGEEAQRRAIETYLGRTDVSADEKTKLLESLTSPASIVTEALLSTPVLRAEDPHATAIVRTTYSAWIKANRFPLLQAQIRQALAGME